MKRLFGVLLCLSILFPVSAAPAEQEVHPAMQPDPETFRQWMEQDLSLPRAFIDPAIKPKRASMSLRSYLPYVPAERNQGNCGNCWTWAATGCMEIEHNYTYGVSSRLSVQFITSCKIDAFPCCGGTPSQFVDWYTMKGFAIPWANTGASYVDAATNCVWPYTSARSCAGISTTPNYPINSISASLIPTQGVGQATAIANIKNVLAQGKAVYWGFWLPRTADWNDYNAFWNNNGESAVWDPSFCFGQTQTGPSLGHAELLVGYNDDAVNPSWEIVNSWGTGPTNNRPNGVNRLKMLIDYDGTFVDTYGTPQPVLLFYTVDVAFPVPPSHSYPVRVDPDRTSYSSSKAQMDLYVETDTLWRSCYPFCRIRTPYYGTYYLTSHLVMYPWPMPYLPYPVTTDSPIGRMYLVSVVWKGLLEGTYYVESGAVDADEPVSPSGALNYIDEVYQVPFTLN